jgi:hypothetical protein
LLSDGINAHVEALDRTSAEQDHIPRLCEDDEIWSASASGVNDPNPKRPLELSTVRNDETLRAFWTNSEAL